MKIIEKINLLSDNGVEIMTFNEFNNYYQKSLRETKWVIIKKNKKIFLILNNEISINILTLYYNEIIEIIEDNLKIKFFRY